VFRERLRKAQWLAITTVAFGVCAEVVQLGRLPVSSLGLAFTFGVYGLLKKIFKVESVTGLTVETALMTPFALIWLVWMQNSGAAHYPYSPRLDLLLAGAGILTALPLILFAWGVGRTKMTVLGFVQYTSPVITFLTATLAYREPISGGRMLSFSLIWAGIIIYAAESLLRPRLEKGRT
jgi:chloramphenicol-sensitive protein RarD